MNVGLLSSASALAVVGYSGTVIFHGNLIALLNQLAKDKAFLAWMASAGILYLLSKQESIGTPVRMITAVAILAVVLKIFDGQTNTLPQMFADFQSGKIDIVTAFETFAVTAGIRLGLWQGGSVNAYSSTGVKS